MNFVNGLLIKQEKIGLLIAMVVQLIIREH